MSQICEEARKITPPSSLLLLRKSRSRNVAAFPGAGENGAELDNKLQQLKARDDGHAEPQADLTPDGREEVRRL